MNLRHSLRLFLCLSFAILLGFSGTLCYAQASSQGQWSAVENWPTRAIHTTLLPDGRVLFISYYDESLQPNIWDPITDTFSPTVPSSYALFCAGHTSLADGRVFIAGGHIADYTGYAHAEIYDPFKNTFTVLPDMNEGRWYPTTTVLANGDVLVVSGDVNSNTNVDPLPQVYQFSTGTWRNLSTAQYSMPLYPVMFVAPNGKVFYAGPEPATSYLDTTGTGNWTALATRTFSGWRDYGPGVMYDTGKVLDVGGSDPPTATAETIDLTAATPAWKATSSMHYARRQHNAVIMPDGKVFIVGGSSGGGFDDSTNPVYPTEMWDPATGQFTVMASIAEYRGYHSTALLLPDGRVLSAGGNVAGPNAQVYSPPYLFAGTRPSISSAPASVGYGQSIFIGTPDGASISQVTWLRNGSTTHTFDESARFMRLTFTQTSGGLTVTTPANGNLAPPGYYMLFLVNSSGVPSVAKIIQITQNGGSTGSLSGTVTNSSGVALAGASVSSGGVSATTAADGSYTLNGVTAGSATVTASLTGYQNGSQNVTVTAGGNNQVATIQLSPISPGNVTGSVVNTGGTGIAGAAVSADGLSTVTDSSGKYTLNNLPSGTQTLDVSATGYEPGSATVTVAAGTTTTASNITLNSAIGNVSGKVTNSTGSAISGASVSFGGGSTTTDANGNYSFTNIPAGTIQLVASATGYQSVTQNVTVTGGTTVTANFSLTAASSSPGTVTGTVTNISTGGIISGATVKWGTVSTTTNSSGVYTLSNVAGGAQTVTASATGYLPVSNTVNVAGGTSTLNFQLSTAGILNVTVVNSSGAVVSGAPVTISGGIIATNLSGTTNSSGMWSSNWIPVGSYTVSSGTASTTATVNTGQTTNTTVTQGSTPTTGTITGTVTNSSGTALSGVSVAAGSITATTAANGTYTLANVNAGTQTITASLAGYQTGSQSVNVTAGGTVTANFSLTASTSSSGTVTGTVTNISNGLLLSGATVKWNTTAVSTDSNGVYTLSNVTGGTQTITASATGYLPVTSTINVSGGTTTLNFQLSTAGILNVTVLNSSGAAVSGASVSISGGIIATTLSGTTNSSGVWSSNWIPIGTYTISSGGATQTATVNTGQTTNATITQGSAPTTGTITGTVTNSSGAALAGATVSGGGISATTASNGTYTLNNVNAGTVTVTASLAGYQTGSQSVNVTAGGTATANFSLTATTSSAGTVTGKVTNISNGVALSGATVKWGSTTVTTSSTGIYTISNVTSGTQTLTASATGYLPRSLTVSVPSGGTATLNFPLATAGKISVKAVNSSGAADLGATVTISGGVIATTVSGTTNSSGIFATNWIPIGTYTVTISESGHTTQSKSASVSPGVTTTVNFTF
jgi:hypothetical protein